MKWVLAWIAALLLGAAVGWRGDVEGAAEPAFNKPKASVGSGAGAVRSAPERVAKVLGEEWRSWAERVRAAKTSAELEGLFREVGDVEDYPLKASMQRLLGARWAEVDPADGALFLTHAEQGIWTLQELMTAWVQLDLQAGVAGLDSLPPKSGSQVPDGVQERLMRRNPKRALEFMRARGRYAHYPKRGLEALAAAHPDELAALIVEIEAARLARGERYHANSYVRAVAWELAKRDPRAAMEWVRGLEGKMGETAKRVVIDRWAKDDPSGAAKYLEAQGEKLHHFFDQDLKNAIAGDDFDKIIALAKTRGSADRSLSLVLAKQIKEGALSFEQVYDRVSEIETNRGWVRYALMRGLWSGMSMEELGGALDLLRSKPGGAGRNVAMKGLLRNWKARDLESTVAAITAEPPGEVRDAMAASLLDWTDLRHSALAFKRVVEALPPADRAAAVGGLLEEQPGRDVPQGFDPRNFAEILVAAPEGGARAVAVERLGTYWGTMDPGWAMEWALGLESEDSARAMAGVAKGWAPHDVFSLSKALLDMPAGAARESATGVLVEALTENEPDSAWVWAQQIDDAAARKRVVEAWAKVDNVAAAGAIEGAELPVAEREALRVMLEQ